MPKEPKFAKGDKVFAKVRGYPAWPARVEGLADETPSRNKYHVFFYGTSETGVCKADELFPYIQNKAKFGKLGMKRKFFHLALRGIENEIMSETGKPIPDMPEEDNENETSVKMEVDNSVISDNEGSLIIDEGLEKKDGKSKMKLTTPRPSMSTNNFQRPKPSPTLRVTTSGRKIKPKKTFDPDDDDVTFSSQSYKALDPLPVTDCVLIKESVVRINTPTGGLVILDINKFTPPENCKTEKALNLWKMNKLSEFQTVKEKVEKGQTVSPEYMDIIKQQTEPETQAEIQKKEKVKLGKLKTEVEILHIDLLVKGYLNLDTANAETVEKCIDTLDNLLGLPISPLMLKKHPEIVDTIRRVQRYVGNISNKKLTEKQIADFNNKAAQVRAKADQIYHKFKSLFAVSDDESFWDTFAKEFVAFNEATRNLPQYDLYNLIEDPSV